MLGIQIKTNGKDKSEQKPVYTFYCLQNINCSQSSSLQAIKYKKASANLNSKDKLGLWLQEAIIWGGVGGGGNSLQNLRVHKFFSFLGIPNK